MDHRRHLYCQVFLFLVLADLSSSNVLTDFRQFVVGKTICCVTPLNVLFGISPLECVKECLSREHCSVLSYQRRSLQCRLFDINSDSSVFEEDDPSFVMTFMNRWTEDLISPCRRQMCSGFTKCAVRADGTPHCVQTESHATQWTLVYETDDNGDVISGHADNLTSAMRLPTVLRVYVPGWNQILTIDPTNIHDDNACSQSLFNIAKDTWNTFLTSATRVVYMLCTNGVYQKVQHYLGISLPNNSTEFGVVGMKWFARHCCEHKERDPIFCNSDKGHQTCGSFPKLLSAIRHGSEIRVVTNEATITSVVDWIIVGHDAIGAQMLRRITTSKESIFANIWSRTFSSNTLYWNCRIASSDGTENRLLYYKGQQTSKKNSIRTKPAKWTADMCWSTVYSSDSRGNASYGSVNRLRASILVGKRVRLLLNDSVAGEPESIFMESDGHVAAQFLDFISISNQSYFQTNASLIWQMISSTGFVNAVEMHLGSYIKISSYNSISSVHWYTDTRPWRKLLTISPSGNVSTGSKSELTRWLKLGSMLRLVVTFSSGTIVAFAPNSIEFYQEDVAAQFVRNVVHEADPVSEGRVFPNAPYWNFVIVTTEGSFISSLWSVEGNVQLANTSTRVTTAWFVN